MTIYAALEQRRHAVRGMSACCASVLPDLTVVGEDGNMVRSSVLSWAK
jgi:hypothetical protein